MENVFRYIADNLAQWVATIISIAARGYSVFGRKKAEARQEKLDEQQEQMNTLYLEVGKHEVNALKSANLTIKIVDDEKGNPKKMLISNSGKSSARNIYISNTFDGILFDPSAFIGILPIRMLSPGGEIAIPLSGSIRDGASCEVKLRWDDDLGSKETTGQVFLSKHCTQKSSSNRIFGGV